MGGGLHCYSHKGESDDGSNAKHSDYTTIIAITCHDGDYSCNVSDGDHDGQSGKAERNKYNPNILQ